MASFEGTNQEFKRYVGPRLRNVVQDLTRKPKASAGACEHCGAGGKLEAAHVHGRDRTQIIDSILGASDANAVVRVDLDAFEARFRAEHEPLEKAFLFLCASCHRKYDASASPRTATRRQASPVGQGVLPITLEPSPVADFKAALLREKAARLSIYYADGRVEHRPWDARRFDASSDVLGNLRSRPDFRQGQWQSAGIVKVHVRAGKDV